MEYVTNVDAKYFTLKDVDSTKVLEANGSISIVGKQEESEVSLGMPITLEQYQNLSNEDFASYSESSNLAENYNLQNLEEVDNILSAESLTFSYATKNSETWNLETVSASEIEAELEAKFTESIRQFFTQRSNNPYFSKTDLRTVTIRTNNYIFGDCFTLEGNVTHERTNTDLSCSILIVPNAENFDLMQSTFSTEGDETKDLSENYTLEQLNILKNVCEVSRIRSYEINGSGYMVQNTSNSENTL